MVERHFYRFPSVDFFGKSMPGLLFTLLGVFLIPEVLFNNLVAYVEEVNLAVVVSVVFVIIVVGFTMGQATNTVAIILQRILYKTGYLISTFARQHGAPDYDFWAEIKYNQSENHKHPIVSRLKYWVWKRYINIKRGFVPHRVIFNDWLRRHLSPHRPDGNQPKLEVLIDCYADHRTLIGEDAPEIPDGNEETHINDIAVPEDVYLFISDYVSHHGPHRSRRHKALFVFCQNTALTFGAYTIAITAIALDVYTDSFYLLSPDYDTVIAHLFLDGILSPTYVLPITLLIGTIVFIYAIGVYKKMYLEYLITDYINNTPGQRHRSPPTDRTPRR